MIRSTTVKVKRFKPSFKALNVTNVLYSKHYSQISMHKVLPK